MSPAARRAILKLAEFIDGDTAEYAGMDEAESAAWMELVEQARVADRAASKVAHLNQCMGCQCGWQMRGSNHIMPGACAELVACTKSRYQ